MEHQSIDKSVTDKEEKNPSLVRAAIIDNIAVFEGLKPSSHLAYDNKDYLSSRDTINYHIYTVILMPDMDEFDIQTKVLSRGSETVFHVLGERTSDPIPNQSIYTDRDAFGDTIEEAEHWEKIINGRHNCSFLVVTPLDRLLKDGKKMQYRYSSKEVSLTPPKNMANPIVIVGDTISPDEYSHLIFPAAVINEYLRSSRNSVNITADIITVGQTDAYYFEPSWRVYDPIDYPVPDYLKALMQISQKIDTPYLVHGVRLPTNLEV